MRFGFLAGLLRVGAGLLHGGFFRLPALVLDAPLHLVRVFFRVHHDFVGLRFRQPGDFCQARGVGHGDVVVRQEPLVDERVGEVWAGARELSEPALGALQRLGRAIVLVTDDQLSLAIGRRGQNVRLASKLVGWDIEIMTHDELGEALERAERWFGQLPHASAELTSALIEEGFLSYNDITCTDAAGMAEFSGLNEEQSDEVVRYAEEYSDVMDRSVEDERRVAEEEGARLAEEQTQADAAAAAAAEAEVPAEAEATPESEPALETPVEEAHSEPITVSEEKPAEAATEEKNE